MLLPWKRSHSRRGAGILTVLVASTLLLLLAFTVAGTSFHHLSISNRLHHAQQARNLAEAALGQAVAELMAHHDKYQGASPPDFIPVTPGDREAVYLTFDPSKVGTINSNLKSTQLQVSVNNFGSDTQKVVGGRTIPGESAYLRAVGVDHGVERAMECVVYIPRFPWAVASSGPVQLSGMTRVSSVKDMADLADPSKELPGHIATNSNAGTSALVLQGNDVVVTGDVQSVSGADLGNNTVRGERRLQSSPAFMPLIDVENYDTSAKSGVTRYSTSDASPDVSGYAYRDGTLNFNSGINLNGGVLYVKGDLNITGPVKGVGAIISTGKVQVTGTGALTSDNKVAILSKGDLTLKGQPSDRLTLNGLIYTEGKMDSEYVNLFGNGVASDRSPGSASMVLKDTNFVSGVGGGTVTPGNVSFSVGGASSGPPPAFSPHQADFSMPGAVISPPIAGTFVVPIQVCVNKPMTNYLDTTANKYIVRYDTAAAWDINGNPLPAGTYRSELGPAGFYDIPAPTGPPVLTNADLNVTLGSNTYAMDDPNISTLLGDYAVTTMNADLASIGHPPLSSAEESVVRTAITAGFLTQRAFNRTALAANSDEAYRTTVTSGSSGSTTGDTFTLDFNADDSKFGRFLSRAEKIRILYWREVP